MGKKQHQEQGPDLFTILGGNVMPSEMTEPRNLCEPTFDGSDIVHELDHDRLTGQILRVFTCQKDGIFRTLGEIAAITRDPEASISAQLRNLRKERFGGHFIDKRRRGEEKNGLWEYQLVIKEKE